MTVSSMRKFGHDGIVLARGNVDGGGLGVLWCSFFGSIVLKVASVIWQPPEEAEGRGVGGEELGELCC